MTSVACLSNVRACAPYILASNACANNLCSINACVSGIEPSVCLTGGGGSTPPKEFLMTRIISKITSPTTEAISVIHEKKDGVVDKKVDARRIPGNLDEHVNTKKLLVARILGRHLTAHRSSSQLPTEPIKRHALADLFKSLKRHRYLYAKWSTSAPM